ncbi:MAG: hypothetical protein K2I80_11045 [Ruminococcus sp.]|nr:hypothetical protein [Ruminococcus sp.]
MNRLQKKRLCEMKNKIFESHDYLQNADYKDLQSFITDFLNESDKKRRKKLTEEFRKRHLELYEFLKDNQELVSSETEISKTVNAVLSGNTANSDDKQLTNLFEIIGDEFK